MGPELPRARVARHGVDCECGGTSTLGLPH